MKNYVKTTSLVNTQCKKYAHFFQKIRIWEFSNFSINSIPTIRRDYGNLKNIIIGIISSKIEVLQFAYTEVLFDFRKILQVFISTLIYILIPRWQMGDFGRQNSLLHAKLVNLLQFLFLQHAWSQLEVLVFLKRNGFTE